MSDEKQTLEPLVMVTGKMGGRPSRYRVSLAKEIMEAVRAKKPYNDIINELGTDAKELKKFMRKSSHMEKAVSALFAARDGLDARMVEKMQGEDAMSFSDALEQMDYDTQLEHGEIEAVRTLRLILRTGTSDSAKVQAAKELLDRKRGKPVQTTHVEQSTTYTIIAAIPAPPNSAHALPIIEGDCEAISE